MLLVFSRTPDRGLSRSGSIFHYGWLAVAVALSGSFSDARLGAQALRSEPTVASAAPEAATPGAGPVISPPPVAPPLAAAPPPEEKRLRFSFTYAPWKDVLDWLASEADLALSLEAPPKGTFNYTDTRSYSTQEAIDVVNSLLLIKGYTLVRRDKMLLLINLEDGIPPNLVMQVTPDQLDALGQYELVSCLFELERMNPEDAENELGKLLGPQGKLVILPASRQAMVTETAGKLRMMRRVLERVENPTEEAGTKITPLPLSHISPDEALVVIRQLMNIPEDSYSNEAGSIRLSTDALGTRLLVKASPKDVAEMRDILNLIDIPSELAAETTIAEAPQLMTYPMNGADPDTTMQVLQTLLAGLPDIRMTLDPLTNNLVALGRPAQHATIRATLDELAGEHDQIEIFNLRVIDPTTARLAIESLFGNKSPAGEKGATDDAPRVDANLTTRQLLVRGRPADVDRIRTLLEKMGEDETGEYRSQKGNIRMLPMYSGSVDNLLKRAESLWPTLRGNRIRTVTPSAAVDAMRNFRRQEPPDEDRPTNGQPMAPPVEKGTTEPPNPAASPLGVPAPTAVGQAATLSSPDQRWESKTNRRPVIYLAQVSTSDAPPQSTAESLPEIIVAPGPNGLLIASEDLAALDEFEKLLETLSDPALSSPNEYTVYYLKYTKAEEAAKLLNMLINGKGSSGESSSAGGGLAEMALGSLGGVFESATEAFSFSDNAQIVPDARINALFVRGSAADIDLIQQLLTVIDQAHSPEDVETMPPPRLIPVYNTSASEIATTVSQIYAQRLASNKAAQANQSQNRQPNVQDIMRAMRRGGGGGGGSDDASESATSEPEVTIGVDARSNSLIVSAPDPLFAQIKSLVAQLDLIAVESSETTRVVTVTRANPATIQTALSSIFGEKIQSTTANDPLTQPGNAGNNQRNRQQQNTNTPAQIQEQIRRRMEFFNAMQRGRGGNGDNSPNRNRGNPQGRGRQ